jgi:hypothetical protein
MMIFGVLAGYIFCVGVALAVVSIPVAIYAWLHPRKARHEPKL